MDFINRADSIFGFCLKLEGSFMRFIDFTLILSIIFAGSCQQNERDREFKKECVSKSRTNWWWYCTPNGTIRTDFDRAKNGLDSDGVDRTPPVPGGDLDSQLRGIMDASQNLLLLSWNPAKDDVTESKDLIYQVFYDTSSLGASIDEFNRDGLPVGVAAADMSNQTIENLEEGVVYYINVIVQDEQGNMALYDELEIRFDTIAPSGTITLEDGQVYSKNLAPKISLSQSGEAVKYQLCLDQSFNGSDCLSVARPWQEFSEHPEPYEFQSDGEVSLFVQFQDKRGHISATFGDKLIIDTTPPEDPTDVSVPSRAKDIRVDFVSGKEDYPSHYHVKICANRNCLEDCQISSALTSEDSPALITNQLFGEESVYFACVQGVDLAGNLSAWTASPSTVTFDTSPPSGTVVLNNGEDYSNSSAPSITLTQTGDAVSYQLCEEPFLTETDCESVLRPWDDFTATPLPHDFRAEGLKTLYVQFKDLAGNISATVSDEIQIDLTAPEDPTNVIVPGATYSDFQVSFTPGTELYLNYYSAKVCDDINCSSCVNDTETTGLESPLNIEVDPLTTETPYYVCVQAVDLALNTSNWVPSISSVTYDTTAPSGTIVIEEDKPYTNSQTIAFELTQSENAKEYQLCDDSALQDNNCETVLRSWDQFVRNPPAYNYASDGLKTLYVQFRDEAGNISATTSDSITIDTTPPAIVNNIATASSIR